MIYKKLGVLLVALLGAHVGLAQDKQVEPTSLTASMLNEVMGQTISEKRYVPEEVDLDARSLEEDQFRQLSEVTGLDEEALLEFVQQAVQTTACFDWDCTTTGSFTDVCTFDAGCTIYGPGIPFRLVWNFGDGQTASLRPSETVITHEFFRRAWSRVTLQVLVLGGDSDTVTCRINIRNVIGPPILPTWGTCSN